MSTTDTRTPASHAVESRAAATAPVRHPLRPIPRRLARKPHGDGGGVALVAPSSVPRRLESRPLVAPTALPDHAGDLIGMPDFVRVRRALGRAWSWLRESFEAAGAVDARLRERRDDDALRMAHSGASPARLF
ncbi:hypothetical protein [Sinomonas gamaensis]|uniref:hypothetical protein n=1 Tax=Sinomonas gamaensis TaxID=2565624 RepID=UPI001109F94A|nr:hypothetical protein [Sinomonas gamaensis]